MSDSALAQAVRKGQAVVGDAPQEGPFTGKLNIYVCEKCRGHIVTRDVDRGVTPFMTDCKATHGCKGYMKSSMYRVFDQSMREDWQWYRPSALEQIDAKPHTLDHLANGGLLLRKAR